MKYLNEVGLSTLWTKIKTLVSKKQDILTFDSKPTASSTRPVTSDGIRTMQPVITRMDNSDKTRLIVWCKFTGSVAYDVCRKFGIKMSVTVDFLVNGSFSLDSTVLPINILNRQQADVNVVKRLRAAIFADADENNYLAVWLDGSISQPGWAYYIDYYPDIPSSGTSHFKEFDPTQYTLVRELTINYTYGQLPLTPSSNTGVLTCEPNRAPVWSKTLPAELGGTGVTTGANKSDVAYANKKLTKTVNSTTSDVVKAETIITDTNTIGNFAYKNSIVFGTAPNTTTIVTYWSVQPTSTNQIWGLGYHPSSGKWYVVYNNKGVYSYVDITKDTTYTFDGAYNASSNKAATVSTVDKAVSREGGGTSGDAIIVKDTAFKVATIDLTDKTTSPTLFTGFATFIDNYNATGDTPKCYYTNFAISVTASLSKLSLTLSNPLCKGMIQHVKTDSIVDIYLVAPLTTVNWSGCRFVVQRAEITYNKNSFNVSDYVTYYRNTTNSDWLTDLPEWTEWFSEHYGISAGDNITIEGDTISATDQVFYATVGTTTYAEVRAARDANKSISAVTSDGEIMPLVNDDTDHFTFSKAIAGNNTLEQYTLNTDNEWNLFTTTLQGKLTAGSNISISGNKISATDQIVYAEYGVTTHAEIKAAILAGHDVVVRYGGTIYHTMWFNQTNDSEIWFGGLVGSGPELRRIKVTTGDVWSYEPVGLQGRLTFDDTPTDGSANPVTSNGIYDSIIEHDTRLATKNISSTTNTVNFNAFPDDNTCYYINSSTPKTNAPFSAGTFRVIQWTSEGSPYYKVQVAIDANGVIYTRKSSGSTAITWGAWSTLATTAALNTKQDKLTFDTTPTSGSSNPVTSNGIYTALESGYYTKDQVDGFIRNWSGYVVVGIDEELPAAADAQLGKIYLWQKDDETGKDNYEEWISDGTAWSKIGTREIDLSPYITTTDADAKYATKTSLTSHTSDFTKHVTSTEKSTWNNKQNTLTAGHGIIIDADVISTNADTEAAKAINGYTVTGTSASGAKVASFTSNSFTESFRVIVQSDTTTNSSKTYDCTICHNNTTNPKLNMTLIEGDSFDDYWILAHQVTNNTHNIFVIAVTHNSAEPYWSPRNLNSVKIKVVPIGSNDALNYATSMSILGYTDAQTIFAAISESVNAVLGESTKINILRDSIFDNDPNAGINIESSIADRNTVAACATRTDTNKTLWFGVGSGGTNRGIYDDAMNSWLIVSNKNDEALIPNWKNIGGNCLNLAINADGKPFVTDGYINSTVIKDKWCLFAKINVTGGVYERVWDFLISTNAAVSNQFNMQISPRITASGNFDGSSRILISGHVHGSELAKFKVVTFTENDKIYFGIALKHTNSTTNRNVYWSMRYSRFGMFEKCSSQELDESSIISEVNLGASSDIVHTTVWRKSTLTKIGSSTTPVYVNEWGEIKACSGEVGSGGSGTTLSETGTSTVPIYIDNNGSPAECSTANMTVGTASVANKLSTNNVGNSITPVYFSNGKPVKCDQFDNEPWYVLSPTPDSTIHKCFFMTIGKDSLTTTEQFSGTVLINLRTSKYNALFAVTWLTQKTPNDIKQFDVQLLAGSNNTGFSMCPVGTTTTETNFGIYFTFNSDTQCTVKVKAIDKQNWKELNLGWDDASYDAAVKSAYKTDNRPIVINRSEQGPKYINVDSDDKSYTAKFANINIKNGGSLDLTVNCSIKGRGKIECPTSTTNGGYNPAGLRISLIGNDSSEYIRYAGLSSDMENEWENVSVRFCIKNVNNTFANDMYVKFKLNNNYDIASDANLILHNMYINGIAF